MTAEAALVLIHGMGATGMVWDPVADLLARDAAHVVAPDLPGHGDGPVQQRYSLGGMAAEVARCWPDAARVTVVGHSLGGVVALALASGWFGVRCDRAIALGVKVVWSQEDSTAAEALAARPPRLLDTPESAAAWAARLAGLDDPDSVPGFGAGAIAPTVDGDGRRRWRARWDPGTAMLHSPPMPAVLAAAACPVLLARGEHDHMNTDSDLGALAAPTATLPGAGHNAHVTHPELVAALLTSPAVPDGLS